jgi:hypothetical protein
MWRCILPGGTGRSEEARGMRSGPKPHLAIATLSGALAAAACAAVPPTGPTVVALPPRGKSLAAFQQEDAGCRSYAGATIGASNAAASEYNLQTRYNAAYTQCMYARGNTVRAPPLYAGAGYSTYARPTPRLSLSRVSAGLVDRRRPRGRPAQSRVCGPWSKARDAS